MDVLCHTEDGRKIIVEMQPQLETWQAKWLVKLSIQSRPYFIKLYQ